MKLVVKTLIGKRKKKQHKEWGLIGFFDSPEVNSQLTLAAFAAGEGKSQLIRRIVSKWLIDNNPIQLAAREIKLQFKNSDLPITKVSIKKLRVALHKKGIQPSHIEQVIKQLVA